MYTLHDNLIYIYSEFMLHIQLFKILKKHKKYETLILATKHSHIPKNVSSRIQLEYGKNLLINIEKLSTTLIVCVYMYTIQQFIAHK